MDEAATILNRYAALERIRRMTRWLDTRWKVPGTSFRFGLDPVLGFIPGVGGVITLAASIYTLTEARRVGAPLTLMLAMIVNVIIDFLVGEIPVIGDLFDFAFKAHVRNLRLLEKWLGRTSDDAAQPLPFAARASA